jgi:serine/threonine protein kinase
MGVYPIREREGRIILACIFSGLDEIHKKGFTHGDIKPTNIMFTKEGYLQLNDFGCSV